jgi:hypothetical protein
MRPRRQARLRAAVAVLAAVWIVAACRQAAPASQATAVSPAIAGASPTAAGWTAARVEQPAAIEGAPTNAPAFCSPCHPAIGTYIDTMVAFGGGYIGLGQSQPPSLAAGWRSIDAITWARIVALPAPDASSISAAVASGGAVVAVGTSGGRAAVWRSLDGAAWTVTTLAAPPTAGATELLTAIAATDGGFVAGGYEESATAQKMATLWRSSDGVTWSRASVTDQTAAIEEEITGIAAGPSALVAVGIAGDERRGMAAVWRSVDGGASWQPVASPSFAAGRMLATAVIAGSGPGFVAVGENVDQTAAAAWTSADGSSWSAAPAQSGLGNFGLQMVMTAVAATPGGTGVVAAGWRSDSGNGSAVVWRSSDGRTWVHLPQDVSFEGAGLAAVLPSPRLLVAGTMGWPDTHAAEVWIAPPGG